MANVTKLIDHLTCSVCYNLFENPKYLSCHHSFCKNCLEMMQPQSVITCPICRKGTTVSAGGVKELDDNFFIGSLVDDLLKNKVDGKKDVKCEVCQQENPVVTYCVDCVLFLCHSCDRRQHHQPTNKSHSHRMVPLTEPKTQNFGPKSKPMKCNIHDAELVSYCEICDQLVCVCCTLTDHNGHPCYPIEDVVEKHRGELKEATAPIENLSRYLSKAFDTIDRTRQKIRREGDEANKNIDKHYDNLILKLEEQKKQLKQQVHDSVSERVKLVTTKLEKVKHAQGEVESIKQLSDTLISSYDQELLSARNQVINQMQHITNKYKKLDTGITQQASVKFLPNLMLFPQFGWLCSTGVPAPYKCEIVDFPTDVYKNHTTKFTIAIKDASGHRCYRGDIRVNALLNDEYLQVSDNKNGQYTVSFVASEVGERKLSVRVDGTQIKESPFRIMVNRPYTTMSKPLKVINNYGGLGRPWGISFGRGGIWAVTDYSTSFVYIYDSKDELVKMIGSPGRREDQFECPFGVAFDDNNNLYVVDGGNSRIQKFDLQGNYLSQFGQDKLINARGVTIHNHRVYVSDKANRCVSVFNINGHYCYAIKSQHLRTPCGVTVGINNQLYVSDCDNHCIHTFTLDGDYIRKLVATETAWGTVCGQLRKPWDLAADLRGNLLVTDADNHQVFIFDKDGICIHCFGSNGQGDGKFSTPFGIALSPKGNIYVCDYENKRIQIF